MQRPSRMTQPRRGNFKRRNILAEPLAVADGPQGAFRSNNGSWRSVIIMETFGVLWILVSSCNPPNNPSKARIASILSFVEHCSMSAEARRALLLGRGNGRGKKATSIPEVLPWTQDGMMDRRVMRWTAWAVEINSTTSLKFLTSTTGAKS